MLTVSDPKTEAFTDGSTLDPELKARAQGAFLGLAVGDALGATVEFLTPQEIRHQHGVHREIIGGGWLKLARGQVTDDTSMSLALGSSILNSGRIDAMSIASAFSEWMKQKPVDIGNTVRRGIVHFRTSGEVSVPENEYDAGNGACMRTLAIVLATLWCEEEDAVRASRIQAHITHNNRDSDAGTECINRMLRSALVGESDRETLQAIAVDLVSCYPHFEFRKRRIVNPSAYIVDTIQVVLQSFFEQQTFEDILVDAVNRGGDADTTGAIAGMLAGAVYGVDAIPKRWLKSLDKTVLASCHEQADLLLTLAQSAHMTENYIC